MKAQTEEKSEEFLSGKNALFSPNSYGKLLCYASLPCEGFIRRHHV